VQSVTVAQNCYHWHWSYAAIRVSLQPRRVSWQADQHVQFDEDLLSIEVSASDSVTAQTWRHHQTSWQWQHYCWHAWTTLTLCSPVCLTPPLHCCSESSTTLCGLCTAFSRGTTSLMPPLSYTGCQSTHGYSISCVCWSTRHWMATWPATNLYCQAATACDQTIYQTRKSVVSQMTCAYFERH